MEKKDSTTREINKVTEALIKELEGLTEDGLHEFFMFFYKMNHQYCSMIAASRSSPSPPAMKNRFRPA